MIIDCKYIVLNIKDKIKNIIKKENCVPVLHIYQVGDNPASNAYIRGKLRDCEDVGIKAELIKLPEDITEDELNRMILQNRIYEEANGILRISLFQMNLMLMVLILHLHFSRALRWVL